MSMHDDFSDDGEAKPSIWPRALAALGVVAVLGVVMIAAINILSTSESEVDAGPETDPSDVLNEIAADGLSVGAGSDGELVVDPNDLADVRPGDESTTTTEDTAARSSTTQADGAVPQTTAPVEPGATPPENPEGTAAPVTAAQPPPVTEDPRDDPRIDPNGSVDEPPPPVGSSQTGTVVGVFDGDTLIVEMSSGIIRRVRLNGIDSPDYQDCYAAEATSYLRSVVGQQVNMSVPQLNQDEFLRLRRYVYAGGAFLNEQVVRRGFAEATNRDVGEPGTQSVLLGAMSEAQGADRGMWGAC